MVKIVKNIEGVRKGEITGIRKKTVDNIIVDKGDENEIKEYKAKEPDCYFIAVAFPERKANRHKEVDGLHEAKRILQGSD